MYGLNVISQVSHYNGRRRVITVQIVMPGGLTELIDRIALLGHFAADHLGRLGALWSLSVLVESDNGETLLINENGQQRDTVYVNRRFLTPNSCLLGVPQGFMKMLDAMAQSGTMLQLDRMRLVFRFDRADVAQGRMKSYIKSTIASSKNRSGLCKYDTHENLCGYQAVIAALCLNEKLREKWRGDLSWFTSEFTEIDIKYVRKSKNRFILLAQKLCRILNDGAVLDGWNMSLNEEGTASKLVAMQPRLQIVIINEVTMQVMIYKRGSQYDPQDGVNSTILMSYTLQHLQLIRGPQAFLGKTFKAGDIFCYNCVKICQGHSHYCANLSNSQCPKCYIFFTNGDHKKIHCTYRGAGMSCLKCNRVFYNEQCLGSHQCRAREKEICELCQKPVGHNHECGKYLCCNCRKNVDTGHRCRVQVLEEPEDMTAEEHGVNYYAFDVESMFIHEEGKDRHVVNFIVVCRCFSEEEHTFASMSDFVEWIHGLEEEVTLFAHNLKGYDGRMVFDYLFDKHMPPQNMLWRGSKIMSMSYGKATFKDTLLHLPSSLAGLPKMFGLDESRFKKGFFPYKFNLPENQNYVGRIPHQDYFNPDQMSSKKRQEFHQWYDAYTGEYDFKQQLIEYCQSDTRILARAIEAYMKEQMTVHPLNPFSRLTIASYAMTLYRTYYMPKDTLCRLSSYEEKMIKQAMHGGRTDTRCMLREWTPEQVAAGVHGKYQDVQSLYPTVQFYDPLPVGTPVRTIFDDGTQPDNETLLDFFGFVCCDIEPTKYLHHPVIVDLNEETGRLISDLLPKKEKVLASPELHLAIQQGYKVTKVYWWYKFESSTDLFKGYFRQFVKAKLQASGVPKWIRTDADWAEFRDYHSRELGITLKKEDMVANAAKKTGAKLLCNSLWGKFGENSVKYAWQRYLIDEQSDKIMLMENDWIDGKIDIMYRKYSSDNQALGMIYKNNAQLPAEHIYNRLRRGHRNIALAAMVTSHARCRLWKELHKLGDRVLYHDTDSIVYEGRPDEYNIPVGRYLGEWECETGGKPITKFVSTGPKCYSYVVDNGDGTVKCDTKVKGITLHYNNAQLINYESMKALVLGDENQIVTQCVSFQYDQRKGTMVTSDVCKIFKQTYEKGFISDSLMIYPFGWEKFL